MTKSEFETNCGTRVGDDVYDEIEIVYLYHPLCKDKEYIGHIWRLGGIVLIRDMMRRALCCRELLRQLAKAHGEVERIQLELDLQNGGAV